MRQLIQPRALLARRPAPLGRVLAPVCRRCRTAEAVSGDAVAPKLRPRDALAGAQAEYSGTVAEGLGFLLRRDRIQAGGGRNAVESGHHQTQKQNPNVLAYCSLDGTISGTYEDNHITTEWVRLLRQLLERQDWTAVVSHLSHGLEHEGLVLDREAVLALFEDMREARHHISVTKTFKAYESVYGSDCDVVRLALDSALASNDLAECERIFEQHHPTVGTDSACIESMLQCVMRQGSFVVAKEYLFQVMPTAAETTMELFIDGAVKRARNPTLVEEAVAKWRETHAGRLSSFLYGKAMEGMLSLGSGDGFDRLFAESVATGQYRDPGIQEALLLKALTEGYYDDARIIAKKLQAVGLLSQRAFHKAVLHYARIGDLTGVELVSTVMLQFGHDYNIYLVNALLVTLARRHRALDVYDFLRRFCEKKQLALTPDTLEYAYSCLLAQFPRHGGLLAREFADQLGHKPTAELEWVQRHSGRFVKAAYRARPGAPHDETGTLRTLQTLERQRKPTEALGVLEDMMRRGMRPSVSHYLVVLRALYGVGDADGARRLLSTAAESDAPLRADDIRVKFVRFKFHIDQLGRLPQKARRKPAVVRELLSFFEAHSTVLDLTCLSYIGRQLLAWGEPLSALTVLDSLRGDAKFSRDNHDSDSLSALVDAYTRLGSFDRLADLLEQFLLDDPLITVQQRLLRSVAAAASAAQASNSPQALTLDALHTALRAYNSHISASLRLMVSNIASLCRAVAI